MYVLIYRLKGDAQKAVIYVRILISLTSCIAFKPYPKNFLEHQVLQLTVKIFPSFEYNVMTTLGGVTRNYKLYFYSTRSVLTKIKDTPSEYLIILQGYTERLS